VKQEQLVLLKAYSRVVRLTNLTLSPKQNPFTHPYLSQISRVMSRLSRIGYLYIYYRSTAAGHPICEHTPKLCPNASFAATADQDIPGRLRSMARVLADHDGTGVLRWD
jgi:hypothetical protein